MDLKQRKLSKSEWESIEIPVSKAENEILQLITSGFSNVHLKINKTDSIFTFLKIEYNTQIEEFMYVKFFADKIKDMVRNNNITFIRFGPNPITKRNSTADDSLTQQIHYIDVSSIVRLKSGDQIRLSRLDSEIIKNEDTHIYEFILYSNLEKMLNLKKVNDKKWMYYYYTLSKLMKNNIDKLNNYLKEIINVFISNFETDIDLLYITQHSVEFIEKNS